MVGIEKTKGQHRSCLARRIVDNRNGLSAWLFFHTVLQRWTESPEGHISLSLRSFHDPTYATHSKVFWDIDSWFLDNCPSVQSQGIRLLPPLSPDIFGNYKVISGNFLVSLKSLLIFFCFFIVFIGNQGNANNLPKSILSFSSYINRSRDRPGVRTPWKATLCQILVSWLRPEAEQQSLGRWAPWLDALVTTWWGMLCRKKMAFGDLALRLVANPVRVQRVSKTWRCTLANKFITCNLLPHLVRRIKFGERTRRSCGFPVN